MQLDATIAGLTAAAERMLAVRETRFVQLSTALDAMSPLKVLARGYSIAKLRDGQVLKSREQVKLNDRIQIIVNDGCIGCQVTDL